MARQAMYLLGTLLFVIHNHVSRPDAALLVGLILMAVSASSLATEWLINRQTGERITMALVLTDEQKVALTLSAVTAAGNPAKLDGVPAWTLSDQALATLGVSDDGRTAVVSAVGLGSVQVGATADADLGTGVRQISGVLDILIVPAEAVALGLSAGTPELK